MKESKTVRTPEMLARMKEEYKFKHVELLIRIGDAARAKIYWDRRWPNLPYPETLNEALGIKPAPTVPPSLHVTEATTVKEIQESVAPMPTHSDNGWPLETTAEVMRKCLNPQLVVARLADGRLVSMRQARIRPWKPGARVNVKLEKFEGDPLYRTY